MNKQLTVSSAAVAALALGLSTFTLPAAAIDVTDVVAEIDAAVTPIGGIGGAVLLVLVAIAAFRWVRRAF